MLAVFYFRTDHLYIFIFLRQLCDIGYNIGFKRLYNGRVSVSRSPVSESLGNADCRQFHYICDHFTFNSVAFRPYMRIAFAGYPITSDEWQNDYRLQEYFTPHNKGVCGLGNSYYPDTCTQSCVIIFYIKQRIKKIENY